MSDEAISVPEKYNTDASIVAQQSGPTAATIYAALVAQRGDTTFDAEEFDHIREVVFRGSVHLAATEEFIEYFSSAPQRGARGGGRPAASGGPRRSSGGSGGGQKQNPAEVEVRFGKYKGMTIADIYDEDSEYVVWLSESAQNDFVKRVAGEYLESLTEAA